MYEIAAAIVGAGFIGPVHAEALRRLGVPIVGALGCDRAESESAARAMGAARAYADFDELLADPAVSAVHLAVPNVLHFDLARRALKAGKHVMCEKPLAMTSAESAELADLADAARRAAGVCYNVRFYPLNLHARAMVAAGEVGEVWAVHGSYAQDWLLYPTDYNWRVLAEQGGELRAVADIGTHWIDLVTSMTGLEVQSVLADLRTIHPTRRRPTGEVQTFTGKLAPPSATEPVTVTTDDCGCVMFRFRGGGRGSLWVSQVAAGRKNCIRYEISGSRCSLAWNSESPNELWIGRRDGANELLTRDPALLADAARPFANYPGGHNEGYPDSFKQCFRAFYDWIAAGDPAAPPLYPTFRQGHHEIVLCEAILRSHREQAWVEVEV